MSRARHDVGFVPVECPGNTGTGATHTSTLLIDYLSRHHDLTVYVSSQQVADPAELPAKDRVEYVLHDELSMLPHPISKKQSALQTELDRLNGHDLVHSYSSVFIPVLAQLDVPTLVTLNSYIAICPKADFRYHGTKNCSGPKPLKCTGCIPATAMNRRQGGLSELKSAYLSTGRVPLVRRSIDRRDEITRYQALSPHLRQDYIDVGFDPDRIRVVPHFYDDRFLADVNSDTRTPDEPVKLLYVGALQAIKGVDVLIEALPHLVAMGIDFELEIVGTGPLEDRLRSLAHDIGVSDRVVWRGQIEHSELPALYRDADIFIYPGLLDEPFGRVILEALASKTPVVSSAIGSMDDIVGSAGLLFEPGDDAQLAESVAMVLSNYEEFFTVIPDHLERFSPSEVVDQFMDLYDETVQVAAPPRPGEVGTVGGE